ncbi:sulfotransferase [Stakelama saccharophila]|uniref:Sulfotransferase n=1 Tax=Stakelama saccharophila TaxID=3075605 RepID=A0ABZ0BCB7_9SPHN|nr:sulfotransferase [Stakelama sp. W311]WNO54842.1 sulfotransferase [Stakelama sp. W311]
MRPIIHIGYHKTATSWFQRFVYPRVASHRVIDRRLIRETFLAPPAFSFDAHAARDRLGIDADDRPAILCEEDLSGVLHNGLMSCHIAGVVAQRLHQALPEAHIVIFVRSQVTAALSWYLQYVREGGTASTRRYLFPKQHRHLGHVRPFMLPHFHFGQLDYRGLVERYDALFGADRVTALPYEALKRDPAALLARMSGALGVDLPDPEAAKVNACYRRGLLPIARAANLFTRRSVIDKATLVHIPYWYTVRKAVLAQLNRVPLFGPAPAAERYLGRKTVDHIAGLFWRSNRWLEARMGEDLRTLGYPLDPPEDGAPPRRRLPLRWAAN